jgi:hypothetical protein
MSHQYARNSFLKPSLCAERPSEAATNEASRSTRPPRELFKVLVIDDSRSLVATLLHTEVLR